MTPNGVDFLLFFFSSHLAASTNDLQVATMHAMPTNLLCTIWSQHQIIPDESACGLSELLWLYCDILLSTMSLVLVGPGWQWMLWSVPNSTY